MRNLKKKVLAMTCVLSIVANVFELQIGEVREVQAAEIIYSGVSGDLNWSIDSDKCLTITGTGDYELVNGVRPVWCNYWEDISTVKVDVDGITSTKAMFRDCITIVEVDAGDSDFSNVTDMSNMFSSCWLLREVDTESWNTSNVEDMSGMFEACTALESIDVSQWDVSNVDEVIGMFAGCTNLTDINIANWNLGDTFQYVSDIFIECESLDYCASGVSGDLFWRITPEGDLEIEGEGDFEPITDQENDVIDAPIWNKYRLFVKSAKVDVAGITRVENMFSHMFVLEEVDLSGLDTSCVEELYSLFVNCNSLEVVDFSNKSFEGLIDIGGVFAYCENLKEIDISNWDIKAAPYIQTMCVDCPNLETVDMSGWNISEGSVSNLFFYACDNISTIIAPANLPIEISLPDGYWYDSEWNQYTVFPMNKENDTTITRRAEEYSYVELEVNGFQISHVIGGIRTVYSVGDVNDKVVERGLVYGVSEYVTKEEMIVNNENKYVHSYAASASGVWDKSVSELKKSKTYSMTIKFGVCNADFFTADIMVRPYAKLSDGSYVYGEVEEYSVYDVADILYTNRMMDNQSAHNYLYTDILSRVNDAYTVVDYAWSDTIVEPYK